MDPYAKRRDRVTERLKAEGLAAVLFEDAEGRRNSSVRYLTGQPGDSLLVVVADGRSVLVAWDVNMARTYGHAGEILAYTDFARLAHRALGELLPRLGIAPGSKVELPSAFAYPRYVSFVEALPDYDLVCRNGGMDDYAYSLRAVKDEEEIAIYRRAASLTDELVERIETAVRSGRVATELDVALLIERECRELGCEGTGFETIAAGPSRSFGIHAFPAFGAGPFGADGSTILDFGLKLEGYTTDVTMTFLKGKLGAKRERMVELVLEARKTAFSRIAPGIATREAAAAVDELFSAAGFAMPHGLGHGIGLDAHEGPAVRNREDNVDLFEAGHIVAIEPGLYDPVLGGVRYEDDLLLTATGYEVLTHSRIVRL
jgi:Xaa-Pro dipeptidase